MLEALFYPRIVAVIGASRTPGKVGYELMDNLVSGGFQGEIIPVNPSGGEYAGITGYRSLRDYPGKVDLSVICTPVSAVDEGVRDSISAGAKAIIVITAGFKEVGPEGAELEERIADLCRSRGVRLLGPNCLGAINTENGMNASFALRTPLPGSISVVSQSGALCTAIMDWLAGRALGLAKLVSIGNKADLNENDFLAAFADDPQTKVIIGYLESITDGDEFVMVAERVASEKPVVVLKAGITASGVRAASSHTGSLAGVDIAYGAAFRRSGVIRADSFETLLDFAVAFSMQPLPRSDRVAVITNAGGPGIMAVDAIEQLGMRVAPLESSTILELKGKLPAAASVRNPIDVLGDADPERYAEALKAAQDDESVDAVMVILTPQAMTKPLETARRIAECARGEKPLLAVFMGGEDVTPGRDELVAAGLPDYPTPNRAAAVLKAMTEYESWRRRPARVVARFPVNRRRVERIISRHLKLGRHYIGEAKAKEILAAYDFEIPPGGLAMTADEAVDIAEKAGYPVAMKISSPDIIHKSDVGGVYLHLDNAGEVRDAFDLMMLRIPKRMPEAELEGVYVEKMAPTGREVIIGMTRDPQFGPMLMFGLGGIFVEVLRDVSFNLAPISSSEALQMLQSTRSYTLLQGARGESAVDLPAIASGLQHISQLVTDFPQISELDINPFIVREVGQRPVVADARIRLGGAS